jgi:hypothetical protein
MLVQVVGPARRTVSLAKDYVVRRDHAIAVRRASGEVTVKISTLLEAVEITHQLIDQIYDIDFDIAAALGPRNLSGFVGELVAAAAIKASGGTFKRNPHQDGYPDLLLMDKSGLEAWRLLSERLDEKKPFSPFPGGGIEVKATCGAVPTPAQCRARKLRKPKLGETRIGMMTGYDWKAHHRETNNLVGVLWDFVEGRPRIVAMFYSSALEIDDWGKIVQPRDGGGRTTSISMMTKDGIRKMYEGWICVMKEGGYVEFLDKRNRGSLMRS